MNRIQRYIDSETYDLSDNMATTSDDCTYSSVSETDSDYALSDTESEITNTHKLNSYWNIWYHHQKNNWKLDSYKKIYKMIIN